MNDKNLTIGVLVSDLDGTYQSTLWNKIVDLANKKKINLFIFDGRPFNAPTEYHEEHNIIYNLINQKRIDGLIMLTGTLGTFIKFEKIKKFCNQFRSIPLVSLSIQIDDIPSIIIDNTNGEKELINHLINDHGYKNIAFVKGPKDHNEANLRYDTFIKSMNENNIAVNKEIFYQGNFMFDSGVKAAKKLIKKKNNIDAVVTANDEMAFGVINYLQSKGIRVPQDIAVVGFDDTEESNYFNPTLTTVKQPIIEQASKAFDMIVNLINGKEVKKLECLPTKLMKRCSCGCFPVYINEIINGLNFQEIEIEQINPELYSKKKLIINKLLKNTVYNKNKLKPWINNVYDLFIKILKNKEDLNSFFKNIIDFPFEILNEGFDYDDLKKIVIGLFDELISLFKNKNNKALINKIKTKSNVLINSVILRENAYLSVKMKKNVYALENVSQQLLTTFDIEKVLEILAKNLPSLKIKNCFISFYQGNIERISKYLWSIPEYSKLVLFLKNGKKQEINKKNKFFLSKKIIPDEYFTNKKFCYIVKPLFFKNEHFGIVIFEIGTIKYLVYEMLRSQISNAIKGAMLIKDLNVALEEFGRHNKELQNISIMDELTGLYNRRGFMNHCRNHFGIACKAKTSFILFFADLDGLKMINDSCGHDEGDRAIINTANILRKTFRQGDIIARLGGDEFTVLAIDSVIQDLSQICERLNYNFDEYNKNSGKSYKLGLSVGFTFFDGERDTTFEELMKNADKVLYNDKLRKNLWRFSE